MTLSEELTWRGFVNQMTFADIKELDETPRTFYWGVDPSADSMTIGNLAAAMMVRHFIDYGYKPILLVGGATGMIGDPDGKKQERDIREKDTVEHNVRGIAEQFKKVFGGKEFDIVNNADWFEGLNYITFLHDIGKHVSLTQMLDRDFVQARIGEGGSGISYAEFSYSLIQGYDFLHLFREKGATLQVAGADQWGNSVTGVSLIRRLEGAEAHVYTAPLVINKATGVKFGKSEDGAVWLDPTKTSPYKFYQFWLNVDDETAKDLIKIYTLLDKETVEALIADHDANPGERALQKRLAREVTALVHGADTTASVENVTRILFEGKGLGDLIVNEEALGILYREIPSVDADTVVEALVKGNLASSNGEARRLIAGGGVVFNGEKISEDVDCKKGGIIKKGKNAFLLVSNLLR
jgi:tyrosyl-tRNA synthetase